MVNNLTESVDFKNLKEKSIADNNHRYKTSKTVKNLQENYKNANDHLENELTDQNMAKGESGKI